MGYLVGKSVVWCDVSHLLDAFNEGRKILLLEDCVYRKKQQELNKTSHRACRVEIRGLRWR